MSRFPFPCLFADVGGTNARFALLATPDGAASPMVRLDTGADDDFAATARRAVECAGWPRPRSFLLAVAGPIEGTKRAQLTNARTRSGALRIDGDAIASALGLEQGLLLNDFEALSLGLPFLPAEGLTPIVPGRAVPGRPMLVVGPGTGLGVGALAVAEERYLPIASEGGHVSFGPEGAAETALWPFLGPGSIQAEELISGRGLRRLYRGALAQEGAAALDDDPAAITARALAGEEPAALRTAKLFLDLLARFAGDMALAFAAAGGVFIGGGIAPRLAGLIDRDAFARGFGERGVGGRALDGVPVSLITAPDAALRGLAEVAAAPERFALDYGRRWR